MPRSLFTGQTDYRHQTLTDIAEDLKNWLTSLNSVMIRSKKRISYLKKTGYWNGVPSDFELTIMYALKYFDTGAEEITLVLKDIQAEVREADIKRIRRLGQIGAKLNDDFGTAWHQNYPVQFKQYEKREFRIIEKLYQDGRDMAVDMIYLINVAERLEDFVGKKPGTIVDDKQKVPWLMLRPNLYGIGVDLKKIPHIGSFLKKNWLIGVTLLVAVILILGIKQLSHFNGQIISIPPSDNKESAQQITEQIRTPPPEYNDHPTPIEIKQEILKQPFLLQQSAGASFIGLYVQWHLELWNITTISSDPNTIILSLVTPSTYYPDIKCFVDLREHPEFKRAKQGTGIFVKGKISNAEAYSIELINCIMKIDE